MNPYISYYNNQVGSGLAGFQGLRYQKGHGFFGRLFSNVLLPFVKQVIPAVGKRALPSAIGLAQDVLAGENVGQSAIKRLKEAGRNVADESLDIIKSKIQGGGRRRKRKFKTSQVNKKRRRKKQNLPNFLK
jgi:hypothetical protein